MSVVDLAKARFYADVVAESEAEAADWIRDLADEVESLQRALFVERQDGQALAAQVGKLTDENADLHTGLEQVLRQVVALLALAGGKP